MHIYQTQRFIALHTLLCKAAWDLPARHARAIIAISDRPPDLPLTLEEQLLMRRYAQLLADP